MSWLDPPEPPSYPPCKNCGSDTYEVAYVCGSDVIGCSDCCREYDADEWAEEKETWHEPDPDYEYDRRREEGY